MRLARRLALWLLAAIGLVLAVGTARSLRQHLALFDADLRRDERTLGRALAHAVERTWRAHGEAAARELLGGEDEEGKVRIRLVLADAVAGSPDASDAPVPALAEIRRAPGIAQARDADGEGRQYTLVSLEVPGAGRPALELSESLADEHAYVAQRAREALGVAAALVAVAGGVAFAVGMLLVGRPIGALVAKARRIGAGDFSGPLALPRRDELALLAGEMNAMAERLELGAHRFAAESDARIAALEQLRHADRLTTVGKLASGLAHELGTPLGVVSGRAQMIADGELAVGEETSAAARTIAEQAERMTRLVRQLLDFARWRGAECRRIDSALLARQTLGLLAPLAARRGVELHAARAREAVFARLDASQLQQALANLVMNAIQATPRGGRIDVAVEARARSEARPGRPAGRYAVLAVEDEGEGISGDRLPEIFDPFYTTKPVGEGTGLGLSVAHGIVEEHGGFIEVASEPGRGSRFEIWLPRDADA